MYNTFVCKIETWNSTCTASPLPPPPPPPPPPPRLQESNHFHWYLPLTEIPYLCDSQENGIYMTSLSNIPLIYFTFVGILFVKCMYKRSSLQWHHNEGNGVQITGVSIVCSTVFSVADQRKHQSSESLAFVRVIHRWPMDSPHKGPVTRKMFPFDDVIMCFYGPGYRLKIWVSVHQTRTNLLISWNSPYTN